MSTSTPTSVTVRIDPTANSMQSDIVHAATPFAAGVMTADQAAELQNIVGGQTVAIYVSDAGSNSNDGLSPSTPLKTLGAAWQLALSVNWVQCRIYLLGTAPISVEPLAYVNSQRTIALATGPMIVGSFATQAGTTGTATSGGSKTVFTCSALAMTVNAYAGLAFLQCVSGANAGARANIQSNTATTVTVAKGFTHNISIGDVYEVVLPNTTLALEAGLAVFGYGNSYIGLQGVNIIGPGSMANADEVKFCTDGVVVSGITFILREHAVWRGSTNSPWANDGAANPFNSSATSGTLFTNCTVLVGQDGEFQDNHMFNASSMVTNFPNPNINFTTVVGINSSFSIGQNGYLNIGGGILDGGHAGASPLSISDNTSADLTGLIIQNAGAAAAIAISNRSFVNSKTVSGATGNTGAGITVDATSQINTNGTTTLTGSTPGTNDLVVNGNNVGYSGLPYLAAGTIGFAE